MTTTTNAAFFTVDSMSAFELETIARQIFAASPACLRTMARVAGDLETARAALIAYDADACAEAVERAAATVYTRGHSAYRAIVARFER